MLCFLKQGKHFLFLLNPRMKGNKGIVRLIWQRLQFQLFRSLGCFSHHGLAAWNRGTNLDVPRVGWNIMWSWNGPGKICSLKEAELKSDITFRSPHSRVHFHFCPPRLFFFFWNSFPVMKVKRRKRRLRRILQTN